MKYCSYCGSENSDGCNFCSKCGRKFSNPQRPKTNTYAAVSLSFGIVSLLLVFHNPLGTACAICAVIFGFIARKAIAQSNGTESGNRMATAGIITGIASVVIGFIVCAAVLAMLLHFIMRLPELGSLG